MPKILHIKVVGRVKEQIHTCFSVNEDALIVRRLNVLSLICDGHLMVYEADLSNLNKTTVQRWIHRLNQSGFDGVRDQSSRGRKTRLIYHA